MTESTAINMRILLAARPTGYPEISDFEIDETPIPAPGSGEILVRTLACGSLCRIYESSG